MEVAVLANMVRDESWTETQGSMGTRHRHVYTSGLPEKDNFKYKSPPSCQDLLIYVPETTRSPERKGWAKWQETLSKDLNYSVLVSLSCGNSILQLGGLKTDTYFSYCGGWEATVKVQADLVPSESPPPALQTSTVYVQTWSFLGMCAWRNLSPSLILGLYL